MPEIVSDFDVCEVIKTLLTSKGDDYYLNEFVSDTMILKEIPRTINQFPCIVVEKMGGAEEGFIGQQDAMGGMGNLEHTSISFTLQTMENISRASVTSDSTTDLARSVIIPDTKIYPSHQIIYAGNVIRIGNEYMLVTDKAAIYFTVTRGYYGSAITTHSTGDSIYFARIYKNAELIKRMRDILKQLLFDYKEYTNPSQTNIPFYLNLLTSDRDGLGITRLGPVYTISLIYDMSFEVSR